MINKWYTAKISFIYIYIHIQEILGRITIKHIIIMINKWYTAKITSFAYIYTYKSFDLEDGMRVEMHTLLEVHPVVLQCVVRCCFIGTHNMNVYMNNSTWMLIKMWVSKQRLRYPISDIWYPISDVLQQHAPCITSPSLSRSRALSLCMRVGMRPEESNFTNASAWLLPYMCTECAAEKCTIAPGCAICSTQCITCHMVHAMQCMPCHAPAAPYASPWGVSWAWNVLSWAHLDGICRRLGSLQCHRLGVSSV